MSASTSMITGLLLGAFLMGCAGQVEKPVDLYITERNPARCAQAWLNFQDYRADIQARNPTIRVEILAGIKAQMFLAAFNKTPPPSDFVGSRIAIFSAPGINGILITIISRENCVKMAAIYNRFAVQMWRFGRPGLSPPFQPPTNKSKNPSI